MAADNDGSGIALAFVSFRMRQRVPEDIGITMELASETPREVSSSTATARRSLTAKLVDAFWCSPDTESDLPKLRTLLRIALGVLLLFGSICFFNARWYEPGALAPLPLRIFNLALTLAAFVAVGRMSVRRWRWWVMGAAREKLERAASDNGDIMDPTLDLARAGGTVGEWTASLERVTRGRYTPIILERSSASAQLKIPTIDAKSRRIRIAIGKAGLDGHINAVKLLAQACMQAGMEVVLAGFKQTPEQLVETALQEDVDLLAVSSLAGAHMAIARETLALLRQRGASEVKVVMGGIIPEEDRQALLDLGVRAVFSPKDSNLGKIVGDLIAMSEACA